MAMTIFRDLPEDLVEEEILCRVQAKYLKGLGSTCKRCNRLFNGDGRFARKHTEKAAKQFLFLMLTRASRIFPTIINLDGTVPPVEVKKTELSLVDPLTSAQFDIWQALHCDGLLLCILEGRSRFVVWNPFTGETRWFQPTKPDVRGRTSVLGYYKEGNNKSYKVLSFNGFLSEYEIYELSSDSWRILDDVIAPGWRIGYTWSSASLKGSTYLFAEDRTKPQQVHLSLARFDFATEKVVPVPLPYQCSWFEIMGLSAVKDEKLSLLLQLDVTSKTEVWVTNKIDETSQVVSWSKILALDLSPDLQLAHAVNFLFDEEKKVVMICERWLDFEDEEETRGKDMIYIVGEDNEVTHVDYGIDRDLSLGCKRSILDYVPSLAQIERSGGKRKRGDL